MLEKESTSTTSAASFAFVNVAFASSDSLTTSRLPWIWALAPFFTKPFSEPSAWYFTRSIFGCVSLPVKCSEKSSSVSAKSGPAIIVASMPLSFVSVPLASVWPVRYGRT